MEPYVALVQTLFRYTRAQFKDLKTFYFHNTIYEYLWEDAPRRHKPFPVVDLVRLDPDSRFIILGDASMAQYELMTTGGSIHVDERSGRPSYERLKLIAQIFPHSAWVNPVLQRAWPYTYTIGLIQNIFPMFEFSLEGLEKAVTHLMRKN